MTIFLKKNPQKQSAIQLGEFELFPPPNSTANYELIFPPSYLQNKLLQQDIFN